MNEVIIIAFICLWLDAIALSISHWLIRSRIGELKSRLETLELDAIHNMKVSGEHNYRLNDLEVGRAENIHDRGEGKNNSSPRIYGRD